MLHCNKPELTVKMALRGVKRIITHILMEMKLAAFGVIHVRNPYMNNDLNGEVANSQAF